MIRVHVIPMPEGWCVRVLGETVVVEATELAAEQAGHAHLMAHGGGELVVHTATHGQARRRVYEPNQQLLRD